MRMVIAPDVDEHADEPRFFTAGRHRVRRSGSPQKGLLDEIARLVRAGREAACQPVETLMMDVKENADSGGRLCRCGLPRQRDRHGANHTLINE
jgi:hypothetical protein